MESKKDLLESKVEVALPFAAAVNPPSQPSFKNQFLFKS